MHGQVDRSWTPEKPADFVLDSVCCTDNPVPPAQDDFDGGRWGDDERSNKGDRHAAIE